MEARKAVCFGICQPGSQGTQSRTRAEFPSGTWVSRMLGPGSPCISDRKLWVWGPALLGASRGAFFSLDQLGH